MSAQGNSPELAAHQHGATTLSKLVDYQQVAELYAKGRELSGELLDRWGAAVRPHLPSRRIRVADIGAGTGIFTRAWPTWSSASVVAVEPADAMVRAASSQACYVRGVAERLPLRDASVDVVWVSTALHHFADRTQAVAEFARVLRPDGQVLVRTYLPERSELGWLHAFPGRDRALARFPRLDDLTAVFRPAGFSLAYVGEVLEGNHSFAESADWVQRMRHADSMLTALTDDEIAQGLVALRADPMRDARVDVSLAVYAKAAT